jgi:hypothetical protein
MPAASDTDVQSYESFVEYGLFGRGFVLNADDIISIGAIVRSAGGQLIRVLSANGSIEEVLFSSDTFSIRGYATDNPSCFRFDSNNFFQLVQFGLYHPRHLREQSTPEPDARPLVSIPVPAEAAGIHLVSVPTSSDQPMEFVAQFATEQDPEVEVEPEGNEAVEVSAVAVVSDFEINRPAYGLPCSAQYFEIATAANDPPATDWTADGLPIEQALAEPEGTDNQLIPPVSLIFGPTPAGHVGVNSDGIDELVNAALSQGVEVVRPTSSTIEVIVDNDVYVGHAIGGGAFAFQRRSLNFLMNRGLISAIFAAGLAGNAEATSFERPAEKH